MSAGGEGSTAPAPQSLEPDRFTEGEPQDTVPQPNTPANDVDHKSLRVGRRVSYKGNSGILKEVNGTTATVDFGEAGHKHVFTVNLTAVNAPEPANDGTDEGPSNPRRRHR
jgi:FKBP-type peptidyl-prolyl cis-trans isomerase 2